jgi:hypothetical protein
VIREVSLSAEIAMRASDLENLPGDPIDRPIVDTALIEQATLLTADQAILSWLGGLERQDARRRRSCPFCTARVGVFAPCAKSADSRLVTSAAARQH